MSDLQLEIVATAVILSAGKSLRLGGFWGVITFIFITPPWRLSKRAEVWHPISYHTHFFQQFN
jgi:hypothetical protein